MITAGLMIDGQERPSLTGNTFDVVAPFDGHRVGTCAQADALDVAQAVAAAKQAAAGWTNLAPAVRERHLLDAATRLEGAHARLVDLIVDESGSTVAKANYEVDYSASLLRTAAGEVRRLYGETFPNDNPQRMSMVLREPLGVVAIISPFNAPLALLAKMVAFPLAAGNTVVAKPSEETPLCAVEFAKILHEAGLPAGVFNVVTGFGSDCGAALVEHPDVHGIGFTGSTEVGRRIGAVAGGQLKRVQLELGGKNPVVVLDDVDPVEAAEICAAGAFVHGGQICMSGSRVIALRPIAAQLRDALAAKARSLSVGDPRDPASAYGPLINQSAVDKVARHVEHARRAGAQVLAGGRAEGLVYAPTVIWEPPRDSAVWRDETFGPVVSITAVDTLDEAIAVANDSPYGLSAAILTRNIQHAMTAARQIHCGSVHVGMHPFQSNAMAPIGGFGASGIGRSGGKYSIEHFTEPKWVSIELGEPKHPF